MVKKKSAAKKPAAKKAPARAAKKAAKKTAPKKPRGGQLELIKGVRYTDLDALCRQIGDNRDEVNELKETGDGLESRALRAMRVHSVTGYKYAGVLLTIVPGDEKLNVKRDRGNRSADGGGAINQPTPAGEEAGSGQDAGEIGDALTEGAGGDDQA